MVFNFVALLSDYLQFQTVYAACYLCSTGTIRLLDCCFAWSPLLATPLLVALLPDSTTVHLDCTPTYIFYNMFII